MWVVENRRGGDSLQLAVFETAVARCRRQEPPEFTMSATNNFLDSVGLESIVQCRLKFVAPNRDDTYIGIFFAFAWRSITIKESEGFNSQISCASCFSN